MQSDPTVMFTYPAMATHGEDGEAYVHHFYDSDRILEGFEAIETILRLSLGHSGMMLRLDGYRRCGGYPEGFKYYDDVMLAAKLCELGRVGYIDEALYRSRQHGVNENLSVSIDVVEREVLRMIDEILDGPLGAKVPDRERLRRRLRQRALVHQATMFAFNDQPRMALRLLRESARRHPTETIVQPATLGLLAWVLVGKSGFDGLQRVRTQVTSALGRH